MPIILEAPYIVNLWLGQLPDYVVPFTRLIILISAIDSMNTPLMTAAQATGRIRLYQSSVGTMIILNLPISYVLLKFGGQPLTVFYVSLCISIVCMFMRLLLLKRLIEFPIKRYIIQIWGVCSLICLTALIIPLISHLILPESLMRFVIVCILCICMSIVTIYGLGLNQHERTLILFEIKKRWQRK